MRRIRLALSFIGSAALAACSMDSPELLAPRLSPASASLSTSASPKGRFILRAGTSGFRADLAARVAKLGGTVERVHAGAGIAVISNVSDVDVKSIASGSGIAEAQPDLRVSVHPIATTRATLEAAADVTASSQANPALAILSSWQWNMRQIGADKAWAAGKLGDPGVTVAIIDTGIDYDNPDLNGLVDLSRSVSFVPSDDAIAATYFPSRHVISDFNLHGTNVAAQVSSKAFAFGGVTSKTTLIGVKVLDATGAGDVSWALSGVLWAADHGADVANLSLGGEIDRKGNEKYIRILQQTFNYAYKKGMVITVAAGNEETDLDHNGNVFAGFCDAVHVICVSAVGPITADGNPDLPAFYTNFGKRSIDVAAPGGNADVVNGTVSSWPWGPGSASGVWSFCSKTALATDANGDLVQPLAYAGCQSGGVVIGALGTSQATPHVAGLAALLVSEYGHFNPTLVKLYIELTAKDIGPRGIDDYSGKGRIDVAKAVSLKLPKSVAVR